MKDMCEGVFLGIERTVDDLGRIVLPKEMRNKLQFEKNQIVSIKLLNNGILIEKSKLFCTFCDNEEDVQEFKNHAVCSSCLESMIEKFGK